MSIPVTLLAREESLAVGPYDAHRLLGVFGAAHDGLKVIRIVLPETGDDSE